MSSALLGNAFNADIRPIAYKMVMLKLVDAARDDGTRIYPSVATIAKAAGVSERHTQRVLRGFVGVGLLTVVSKGGRGKGDCAHYTLDVAMLQRLATSHRVTFENGEGTLVAKGDMASPRPERVTSEASQGDSRVTQPLKDPLSEREGAQARGHEGDPAEGARLPVRPVGEDAAVIEARDGIERCWPDGAVGNRLKALGMLGDLTPAERKAAVDAAPRFLRALRDEKRSRTPAIETYLGNRDWERFPPPKKAEGVPDQGVNLKPWCRPLWALFARRYRDGRSVNDALGWISRGMVCPTPALPTEAEERALVPVMPGSDEAAAWVEHATRRGFRLPIPDGAPMWLPSARPEPLSLRWNGYRMLEPATVEIRGPEWWWRVYRPGAPAADMIADRSVGRLTLTMGPVALPAEAAAMVPVSVEDETWPEWEMWFAARNIRLLMPLEGHIWAPAKHPRDAFPETERQAAGAAA